LVKGYSYQLSAIRFRVHGLRLVEKEKIEADGWKLIAES
jgi:hypothetical protein